MKKLSLVFVAIIGLFLAGCQQDMPIENPDAVQDVVFNIGEGEKGLKGEGDCSLSADYAMIVLNQDDSNPLILPVFNVNGVMYTATLKLKPGNYSVDEFILFSQIGNDPNPSVDMVMSAAPHENSGYGLLVDNPLAVDFVIDAFTKKEVSVDVLCYEAAEFEEFGFTWLKINFVDVKEGLFFGDFCSEDFADYDGSLYGNFPKYDMPAIFEIELILDENGDGIFDASESMGSFNNYLDQNGNVIYTATNESAAVPPLSIPYVDRPNEVDSYKMIVKVYQANPDGNDPAFKYVKEAEWFFNDNISLLSDADGNTFGPGTDGVYDFIAGPCEVIEFDIDLEDPGDPDDDDCKECDDLASLTLRYDGAQAATIKVQEKDKAEIFNNTVNPGEEFTVYGTKDNGEFDENEIRVYINGGMDVAIHVSCSKPVNPGLSFGSFTITDAVNEDGTHVCPDDGNGNGDDCEDCDKLNSLTLKYNGTSAATIVVTEKDKSTIFNSMVNPGAEFTVSSSDIGEKFDENELWIKVDGSLDAAIHVSCSQPVGPGLVKGSFTVVDAVNVDGTHVCELDDNGGGDDDDNEIGTETAYAFGGTKATCFLDIQGLNNSRWGWTNKIDGTVNKDYSFAIYAGAAQCDPTKGTHVGDLKVKVKDGEVDVKYDLKSDYRLSEVHLYVGADILPIKNGEYTVSGGQFPYKEDGLNDDKYEFKDIDIPDGDFYIVAHSVVKDK